MLCVQTGMAGSAARSTWREEGHGADLSAVAGALIALLLGYLDAALPHNQQHSGQTAAAEEDMQVCCSVFWLCTDDTALCDTTSRLFRPACCCAVLEYLKSFVSTSPRLSSSNSTEPASQSGIHCTNHVYKSSVQHKLNCSWSCWFT